MSSGRIALVGGETLLGQEVRDVLRERLPKVPIKLVGSEDEGEAVVMTGLDGDALAASNVVILAGSPESSAKALEMLDETLEVGDPRPAILNLADAHPVALMLGRLLRELHARLPIRRCVAHVLVPASARGRAGVEELQQQTTQLLTFKPLQKSVFGDQLAFNLLPGGDHPATIRKHLGPLLGGAPIPSLRILQAPVMHGYAANLWIEFAGPADPSNLDALTEDIDYRGPDLDPPTPVGIAGQDGLFLGAAEVDPENPNALWLWVAADNLRIAAVNAARAVQRLLDS
jgi:aspartate-semialdehyde dehydrogenase